MKVSYEYASPSMCINDGEQTVLGLSPDLSREEKVSFSGKLKHPLVFRDAMLMLREIVISDMREKKKERVEFFEWLEKEIDRRVDEYEKEMKEVRVGIQEDIDKLVGEREEKNKEIKKLGEIRQKIKKEIDKHDIWSDYNKIERDFWKFIRDRDYDLWFVLDPVITVHPDQVSFEAFSLDESTYGCLSVEMDEFEMLQEPQLGTTNIDFSSKLAKEMERFRTYTDVELSVNPGGFTVDSGVMPEYVEKKIDLPETWIKGFNQVSAAASLDGVDLELTPVDMYDICSFLRRHKARKSPRYMKWVLEPGKPVKLVFEPFGKELTLKCIYNGQKKREEKMWGRRRWLVMEKLISLAKSFKVRLLGFGMPQMIVADMGMMKMTIGFSSWSSNDWVKGTAFNILGGFVGEGKYEEVYKILKEHRSLSMEEIYNKISDYSESDIKAGVGMLLKRGEGYYDVINDNVRFRQLCNEPIPSSLYESTDMELKVQEYINETRNNFKIKKTNDKELIATDSFKTPNLKRNKWKYYGTDDYDREFDMTETQLNIDEDGQIAKLKCTCSEFKSGPRNISAPCSHILALYMMSSKFFKIENLEENKEYKMNDVMELLL